MNIVLQSAMIDQVVRASGQLNYVVDHFEAILSNVYKENLPTLPAYHYLNFFKSQFESTFSGKTIPSLFVIDCGGNSFVLPRVADDGDYVQFVLYTGDDSSVYINPVLVSGLKDQISDFEKISDVLAYWCENFVDNGVNQMAIEDAIDRLAAKFTCDTFGKPVDLACILQDALKCSRNGDEKGLACIVRDAFAKVITVESVETEIQTIDTLHKITKADQSSPEIVSGIIDAIVNVEGKNLNQSVQEILPVDITNEVGIASFIEVSENYKFDGG